jgi:general nucleoside transport system permease protein
METEALGWIGVPLAVLSGAIRVGTPFLYVSLGECITEKGGRINVGQEGILVMGAMVGFAVSYLSGSPWLGVLAAAGAGSLLGMMHALFCSARRVNDIAIGIALMLFGSGLAFFFGKPYLNPSAPQLPAIPFGWWSNSPQIRSALEINLLFIIGLGLVPLISWGFRYTRWGLMLRTVGDSRDAALSLGIPIERVRLFATMLGGALSGIGGAFLSLYYPGSWNEGLSSLQGLMAVVLVIFARWDPVRCLWAALLFGGAGALAPALQSVGISTGYQLIAAAPYVLTLAIMIMTSSPRRGLVGAPGELVLNR